MNPACLLVKQELTAGLGLSGSGSDGEEARRAGDSKPGPPVPSATVGLGTGHDCVAVGGQERGAATHQRDGRVLEEFHAPGPGHLTQITARGLCPSPGGWVPSLLL